VQPLHGPRPPQRPRFRPRTQQYGVGTLQSDGVSLGLHELLIGPPQQPPSGQAVPSQHPGQLHGACTARAAAARPKTALLSAGGRPAVPAGAQRMGPTAAGGTSGAPRCGKPTHGGPMRRNNQRSTVWENDPWRPTHAPPCPTAPRAPFPPPYSCRTPRAGSEEGASLALSTCSFHTAGSGSLMGSGSGARRVGGAGRRRFGWALGCGWGDGVGGRWGVGGKTVWVGDLGALAEW
jgi:hypothetical protein